MRTAIVFLALLLLSCGTNPPGKGGENEPAASRVPPVGPPPGYEDELEEGGPENWLARAEQYEGQRRPVEALKSYRKAMQLAPADWPAEKRDALREKIARLAFVLGVPGEVSEQDSEVKAEAQTRATVSDALQKAREAFRSAQEAEGASRSGEALALYRKVLSTIREQDDKTLYWQAWQKVEDLSPEGEGPGAIQEKMDRMSTHLSGAGGVVPPPNDGTFIRTGIPQGRNPDETSLGEARTAYVKGMEFVRENDSESARRAFEQVLSLIDEGQDPELFRAAIQNLRDLGSTEADINSAPNE